MTTEATTTELQPIQRGGAPKHNTNAQRHGLRMGALPPGCPHIGRDLNRWRRDLEAAVLALRGVVGVVDAATINRVVRCERSARLAERWIAAKSETMADDTMLAFLRESAKWVMDRDRAIADLELDQKQLRSLWAIQSGPSVAPGGSA